MDDLISRQAAYDTLSEYYHHRTDIQHKALREALDLVPSVQPEHATCYLDSPCEYQNINIALPSAQQWIPCSERPPEDYEDVLVWFEYFRYGNYNCLYQMYGIGSYSSGYNSWLINQETGWNELKVFAWMPLPKPPKEEDE